MKTKRKLQIESLIKTPRWMPELSGELRREAAERFVDIPRGDRERGSGTAAKLLGLSTDQKSAAPVTREMFRDVFLAELKGATSMEMLGYRIVRHFPGIDSKTGNGAVRCAMQACGQGRYWEYSRNNHHANMEVFAAILAEAFDAGLDLPISHGAPNDARLNSIPRSVRY